MIDKLIELIVDAENDLFRQRGFFLDRERIEKTVDYLISHGVTFAGDNNVLSNAEPVKHGRWIDGRTLEKCSICGKKGFPDWRYCPNCGAKMDLEDTKNESL